RRRGGDPVRRRDRVNDGAARALHDDLQPAAGRPAPLPSLAKPHGAPIAEPYHPLVRHPLRLVAGVILVALIAITSAAGGVLIGRENPGLLGPFRSTNA